MDSIRQAMEYRLLAIDDEPYNLDLISEIFDDEAYDLRTADCGEKGLEIIKEFVPEVVLLDIMMPGMDGYEVCQLIKANKHLKHTKVVLISGKSMSEEKLKGYQSGADDYLVKPFINSELKAKVNNYSKVVKYENKLLERTLNLEKLLDQNTKRLIQNEKMASIGQLAAGVAHEINNPVGFVSSNLESLKEYVEVLIDLVDKYDNIETLLRSKEAKKVDAILAEIKQIKEKEDFDFIQTDIYDLLSQSHEGTQRVVEIVRGLKSFARVDDEILSEASINEIIDSALKLVWNELKYKCELKKHYADLPKIRCYSNQLCQVFMNILVNASHAIEEKGIITIKTEFVDEEIRVHISDTGSGIDESNLSMLFNPFFTTKPVGQGTGLGLSISYGIVEKHQGDIEIKSTVGEGSTFTIKIPANIDFKD